MYLVLELLSALSMDRLLLKFLPIITWCIMLILGFGFSIFFHILVAHCVSIY